jgi:hypothetical protein
MTDQEGKAGILVTGDSGERVSHCLTQGAVVAFQSLFFSSLSGTGTIYNAAEDAFTRLRSGRLSEPTSVATLVEREHFARAFVDFTDRLPATAVAATQPSRGDIDTRTLNNREAITLSNRAVNIEPGTLTSRSVGGISVMHNRTNITLPEDTFTARKDVDIVGGNDLLSALRTRSSTTALRPQPSGCTACSTCAICSGCIFCAEVNFGVAFTTGVAAVSTTSMAFV